ncbi:MAG TPA: nucleotide exchange factor GrpE [Caldithrix abyssi]|uniref:Protein GrpE n=1 Tax=Caldithrix abyssi TaxID=187145 RepID=A0A7V4U3D8_CALAY|nr:nucleotide exchange factor GrpE [Caldithrix abyssi]
MTEMDKEFKETTVIEDESSDISTEEKKKETATSSGSKKTSRSKKGKSKESGKIKELQERIHKLEQEKEQLRDQALRKMAEFDNYKRRTEKEFLSILQNASESLIVELLPVLDDFERFLEHAKKESENNQSMLEGVELIYKKLSNILEKQGLKKMETIGQEFDPEKHQALMQVESEEHESGHIVEEHLKGYTLNDKVIRHSQVLVAK